MLDIKLIREKPDFVKANLERRNNKEILDLFDVVVSKDSRQRELIQKSESLRKKRNDLTREADELRKANKDFSPIVKEVREINSELPSYEQELEGIKAGIKNDLMSLPNIMHESVPIGKDDPENVVVKTHGKIKKPSFEIKHHGQIAAELGIADFERAVKISGSGFYFLKGDLALLDFALQNFAIGLLVKKGYTLVEPPFMMGRKPYEGVTDLHDFENVMYKIEGEDLYLIATSEHPMGAMYMDETIEENNLPIKFAGISACFRKEIGKHGLDERGLFRVHQFNKIEQFIFCMPEDSWKFHEALRKNAEELLEALEIPYNVTNICTGDLGTVAAKKYDLNGWSPREQKYIELMSCSNCTSYQSARLGIRYRKKDGSKDYLHTLNSTMVATTRALRIILENYQTAEGTVKIPKVLQPYMYGKKEILPNTKKEFIQKQKKEAGKKK